MKNLKFYAETLKCQNEDAVFDYIIATGSPMSEKRHIYPSDIVGEVVEYKCIRRLYKGTGIE